MRTTPSPSPLQCRFCRLGLLLPCGVVDMDAVVTVFSPFPSFYLVHHGPTVAQPIHLDSAQLSPKFISDYLWSLVDTTWEPEP